MITEPSASPEGLSLTRPDSETEAEFQISRVLRECWNGFLRKAKEHDDIRKELDKGVEKWRDILDSLRSLNWQKVQSYLEEIDPWRSNHVLETEREPATLFWSPGGRIHYANINFCKLTGHSVEELRVDNQGREKIKAHTLFHPEEMVRICARQLDAVQRSDVGSYSVKTRLISKFRQEIPVYCAISNLRDSIGLTLLTVAYFISCI